MKHEIIDLPMPRRVKAVFARCRNPQEALVIDTVPLRIRSMTSDEAPVALRLSKEGRRADLVWRECGGQLVENMSYRYTSPEGIAERYAAFLATGSRAAVGGWNVPKDPELYDVKPIVGDTDDERLNQAVLPGALRNMVDDGMAGQQELRRTLEERMVLVDGELHVASPMPVYACGVGEYFKEPTMRIRSLAQNGWSAGPADEDPWLVFQADEIETARAFTSQVGVECGDDFAVLEIVDREAYGRVREGRVADVLLRSGRIFLGHVRHSIGFFGDDAISAYLVLRRACGAGVEASGGEAAFAQALQAAVAPYLTVDKREGYKRFAEDESGNVMTCRTKSMAAATFAAAGIVARISVEGLVPRPEHGELAAMRF